jgi:CBS domain-containing protein
MTPIPQACYDNETIKAAAREMAIHNVGILPVVDQNKKVVGVITDRDVCLAIGKNESDSAIIAVKEAMTKPVNVINADDDVWTALKMMRTEKVNRLPVIDGAKDLVGVISIDDILRNFVGSEHEAEIEYQGKENVVNTLIAIARRNERNELAEEPAEE